MKYLYKASLIFAIIVVVGNFCISLLGLEIC